MPRKRFACSDRKRSMIVDLALMQQLQKIKWAQFDYWQLLAQSLYLQLKSPRWKIMWTTFRQKYRRASARQTENTGPDGQMVWLSRRLLLTWATAIAQWQSTCFSHKRSQVQAPVMPGKVSQMGSDRKNLNLSSWSPVARQGRQLQML